MTRIAGTTTSAPASRVVAISTQVCTGPVSKQRVHGAAAVPVPPTVTPSRSARRSIQAAAADVDVNTPRSHCQTAARPLAMMSSSGSAGTPLAGSSPSSPSTSPRASPSPAPASAASAVTSSVRTRAGLRPDGVTARDDDVALVARWWPDEAHDDGRLGTVQGRDRHAGRHLFDGQRSVVAEQHHGVDLQLSVGRPGGERRSALADHEQRKTRRQAHGDVVGALDLATERHEEVVADPAGDEEQPARDTGSRGGRRCQRHPLLVADGRDRWTVGVGQAADDAQGGIALGRPGEDAR